MSFCGKTEVISLRGKKTARLKLLLMEEATGLGGLSIKLFMSTTGRVLKDVDADIIAVIEAEQRITLKQFSDYVLKNGGGKPYANVMLIDGNDSRGIDVGIMTKTNYKIGPMKSQAHDLGSTNKPVFSRDCPEYCVEMPHGEEIWILPNHFKSKFGGNNAASQDRRKEQATRTAEIYEKLRS